MLIFVILLQYVVIVGVFGQLFGILSKQEVTWIVYLCICYKICQTKCNVSKNCHPYVCFRYVTCS